MGTRHPLLAFGIIGMLLTGCFGGAEATSPAVTALPTASDSPLATATADPAAPATAAPTAEPVPSDALGEFSCDLPLRVDATVPRANISDLRVGTHEEFDRFVIELTDGVPEAILERAEPPFTEDGSGFPIEVEGSSFLRLVLRGGTRQMDDGSSSYEGPTEFQPDFPTLEHVVIGGDFEGQSTWYLGLGSEVCVRLFALTDDGAPRLVLDIER